MSNQVRFLRLPCLALAAIAGTLWSASEVTACTTDKAPESLCCCAPQMSSDSGCCSKADHRLETTLPSPERAPGTSFTATRVPCATCVCGQPTSPARQGERRETRTSEESSSEASPGSLQFSHSASPSLAPSPVTQTEPCPLPYSPLLARRAPDHLNRSPFRDRPDPGIARRWCAWTSHRSAAPRLTRPSQPLFRDRDAFFRCHLQAGAGPGANEHVCRRIPHPERDLIRRLRRIRPHAS